MITTPSKLIRWIFAGAMPQYFAAWIPAIATVAGSLISSNASQSAADTQAGAARNAADTQWNMFNTVNQQQEPYRTAGYGALSKLSDLLGIDGGGTTGTAGNLTAAQLRQQLLPQYTIAGATPTLSNRDLETINWFPPYPYSGSGASAISGSGASAMYFDVPVSGWTGGQSTVNEAGLQQAINQALASQSSAKSTRSADYGSLLKPFSAQDLSQWQDPGYQFRLSQGLGAIGNSAAAQGGLLGGNLLKGIMDYGQGSASQEYQNAFNRYTTNQTNIYNRLANIAGLGQVAANTSGQLGTQLAGNIGSAQMAGGAAQAAGQVGSANALSGGINNAMGWYSLSKLLKNPGSNSSYDVPSSAEYAANDWFSS